MPETRRGSEGTRAVRGPDTPRPRAGPRQPCGRPGVQAPSRVAPRRRRIGKSAGPDRRGARRTSREPPSQGATLPTPLVGGGDA